MSEGDNLIGVVMLKMKVINIKKITRLFVIDKKDLKHNVVLGFDSIVAFKLGMCKKLEITQNFEKN